MSFFELQNISYAYPGETQLVLKDLTLSVEKGECLIVRGDNG